MSFIATLSLSLLAAQEPKAYPPAPVEGVPVNGDIRAAMSRRAAWALEDFRTFKQYHGNPKVGLPQALGTLQLTDGKDPKALQYVSRVMDHRLAGDTPELYIGSFPYPPLARFLYTYGKNLSDEQAEHLKSTLVQRGQNLLANGTENQSIMRWSSGYLFAQYYPDAVWKSGKKTYTQREFMAEAKRLILARGRQFFQMANGEGLSPTYMLTDTWSLTNLMEFAKDPEIRLAAEALLDYHVTQIALNIFDGHVIAPYNRQAFPQMRFGVGVKGPERLNNSAQTLAWYYWGQNKMEGQDIRGTYELPYLALLPMVKWTPPNVINRIANGSGTPYTLQSSLPFTLRAGAAELGETLRRVYRTPNYAIGVGGQTFDPKGFYQDYNMFNVVWKSNDRYNYIECGHPYWRSNDGGNDWSHGATSPFQQEALYKNAAIVLCDIPKKDPYQGQGIPRWTAMRDQHYDNLLAFVQARIPKSMDETVTSGDWTFLREGTTYIGIRSLRPGAHLITEPPTPELTDFNILRSEGQKVGFLYEVSTEAEAGSFSQFQKKVTANPLKVDWDRMEVRYTTAAGDRLRMKFQFDPTPDAKDRVRSVPDFWVNDKSMPYRAEPVIDSPVATLDHGVLTVREGGESLVVDWSGEVPTIRKSP